MMHMNYFPNINDVPKYDEKLIMDPLNVNYSLKLADYVKLHEIRDDIWKQRIASYYQPDLPKFHPNLVKMMMDYIENAAYLDINKRINYGKLYYSTISNNNGGYNIRIQHL